jgi:hypothetical protein
MGAQQEATQAMKTTAHIENRREPLIVQIFISNLTPILTQESCTHSILDIVTKFAPESYAAL